MFFQFPTGLTIHFFVLDFFLGKLPILTHQLFPFSSEEVFFGKTSSLNTSVVPVLLRRIFFLEKLPILTHQLFPFSSEEVFFWKKTIASVNFLFRAKMADGTIDAETACRLLLCVRVCVCNGCYLISYFFPQIGNCVQMMLQSATSV